MRLLCFLLFLFIPHLSLSMEVNDSNIEIGEGSQERENRDTYPNKAIPLVTLNRTDNPNTEDDRMLAFSSRTLLKRLPDWKCKKYWGEWRHVAVEPADSSHIWVLWDSFLSRHCTLGQKVIVNVDGEEQTSHLTSERQHVAYVKADPCLSHRVTVTAFEEKLTTEEANYNSEIDFIFSGFLHATISERTCLNKDDTTVTVLEPLERLRSCIVI